MEFRLYFEEQLSHKGDWISFPCSLSEFEGRIRAICVGAPECAEHFMEITDKDYPHGLWNGSEPFSLATVNERARWIEDIDEEDWEIVECLIDNGHDVAEACRIVSYEEYTDLRDCRDDEDLVRSVTDQNELCDLSDLPDYITDNIDWSAAASDLLDNYSIYGCGGGYIMIE